MTDEKLSTGSFGLLSTLGRAGEVLEGREIEAGGVSLPFRPHHLARHMRWEVGWVDTLSLRSPFHMPLESGLADVPVGEETPPKEPQIDQATCASHAPDSIASKSYGLAAAK